MATVPLWQVVPPYQNPQRRLMMTCIALLVALSPTSLNAQHPTLTFDKITSDNGLAHPSTYDVIQDRQGFLWFGTETGMSRFDGFNCITVSGPILPWLGGAQNLIYEFIERRNGIIWAATPGGGFLRYDQFQDTVIRFTTRTFDDGNISSNSAYAVLEDARGTLWLGSAGGLDTLNQETGRFHHVRWNVDQVPDSTKVTEIYENRARPGVLWIGTWGEGLLRFDQNTGTWTSWQSATSDPSTLADNSIRVVFQTATDDRTLWAGTEQGGLNRLDLNTNQWTRYPIDPAGVRGPASSSVRCIAEDSHGILYIGGQEGLHTYDPASQTFRRHISDPHNPSSISHGNIRSLRFDDRGDLWIATRKDINRIDLSRSRFLTYRHDPDTRLGLPGNEVGGIAEERSGTLWIATLQGLARFDRIHETWDSFRADVHQPGALRTDQLWTVLVDRMGTLWVGGSAGWLHRYDARRNRFASWQITNDPANISINQVFCLHEDRCGRFWAGTYEGLQLFDRVRERWTRVGNDGRKTENSMTSRVYVILEDRRENLWVGSELGGLLRLNPATGTLDPPLPALQEQSLSTRSVISLFESSDGSLWVGTRDGGLSRYDPATKSFTAYQDPGGASKLSVMSILEDATGRLWVATTDGLFAFTPRSGRWHRFDVQDGLQSNHFYQAAAQCRDGMLALGGSNGMTLFHPESLWTAERMPRVVLTDYRLNEQVVHAGRAITYLDRVVIPPTADVFSFEFAALDYHRPDKCRYAYMLERINRDWVHASNRRYVAYTRPDPGTYVFRVMAANGAGVWNDQGLSITVVVEPRLWERWWFQLSLLLAALAVIAAFFRYRLGRLMAMEQLRMRIAGDLHDEIGTGLSSVALTTELVQQNMPPDTRDAKTLSEVARTARKMADNTRDIVWVLAPEHERLNDLIVRMRSEAGRLLPSVDCSFTVRDDNPNQALEMEFRRHVLMIYKEMVHNVVRHARATRVDIQIVQEHQNLSITVRDNGVGFDLDSPSTGYGLNGLHHRASLIGGQIIVKTAPGKGTAVGLTLKIPQTRD